MSEAATKRPDENDILRIVHNTITGAIRRIGHQLAENKWKEGPVIYGYHHGHAWWQDCARKCKWRFAIEKQLDIAGRTRFDIRAVVVHNENPFMQEILESHSLFEIVLGPDLNLIGDYTKQNVIIPLDENVMRTFVLGSKDCLCSRLTNFI
jgi:hypothetical protein